MARHAFRNRRRFHLKMEQLPRAVRKDLATAAEQNAREVSARQVQTAPKDKGDLKNSHKATPIKSPVNVVRWRISAGDDKAFYARMIEFGTPRNAAQPWFYPSYRVLRAKLKRRNATAARRAIRRIANS